MKTKKKVLNLFCPIQKKKDINIFIGPEGGLSEDNIQDLSSKGFKSVSLGNRILRADTAPICALSIIQYELGDIE